MYILGLDAGHGGGDCGAVNHTLGQYEKDWTRSTVDKVKKLLEGTGEFSIIDCRPGDTNPDLYTRCLRAVQGGASTMISYHLNAFNGSAYGAEIAVPAGESQGGLEYHLREALKKHFKWRKIFTTNINVGSSPCAKTLNSELRYNEVYNFTDWYGINRFGWQLGCSADIVEQCFIDNVEEMTYYMNNHDAICLDMTNAICTAYGVDPIGGSVSPTPTPDKPATTVEAILGSSKTGATVLQKALATTNGSLDPRYNDLASVYVTTGAKYGVRGDIAFCQMIKETGWLRFGGDVKPEQNNFAGIGAIGGGAKGASFATIQEGVTAHIQHLFAYASKSDLPSGETKVDPRFDLVTRGCASTWSDLDGKWAVPGVGYGSEILVIYNKIKDETTVTPPPVQPEKPAAETYTVAGTLVGYYTAAEAASQQAVNRTGTVAPGTYYVFTRSVGMINVSTAPNSAGSWINPNATGSASKPTPSLGNGAIVTANGRGTGSSDGGGAKTYELSNTTVKIVSNLTNGRYACTTNLSGNINDTIGWFTPAQLGGGATSKPTPSLGNGAIVTANGRGTGSSDGGGAKTYELNNETVKIVSNLTNGRYACSTNLSGDIYSAIGWFTPDQLG